MVVLDLTLPGASGLDLLKTIRRERPGLPVLVLSMVDLLCARSGRLGIRPLNGGTPARVGGIPRC